MTSPYVLRLDGRTVRITSRFPPYGTLWMLDAPGGRDARFEADVRYAAEDHGIERAAVTRILRACERFPRKPDPKPVEEQREFVGEEP